MRNGLITSLIVISAFAAHPAHGAGTFSSAPINGDADSGISPSKTYTHAVDLAGTFGGTDPGTAVNGVPFVIGSPTGSNYSTTGFVTNLGGIASNSTPSGDNTLADVLADFFYNGTGTGTGVETLTLTGLTPGTSYTTTFYNMGFDLTRTRVNTVTTSDGGSTVFDQNSTAEGIPSVLRYTFTAAGPSLTFTFAPQNVGAPFHQYGFTNEVVPEPGAALCLLAVTPAALRRRRD